MHPDMMGELARQRGAERRAAARNASIARALRKAIRAQRTRTEAPDTFVVPTIPDYVDETFHAGAGAGAGAVPAQRAGASH